MLRLLVELDQRFGEPVQVLVLASLHVNVGKGKPGGAASDVKCLPETRKHVP